MKRLILPLLLIIMSCNVNAEELNIPQAINAKAEILRKMTDGLWEKTLILVFPKKRKIISTNKGIFNAKAVAIHSAHPNFWGDYEDKDEHEKTWRSYIESIYNIISKRYHCKTKEISVLGTVAHLDNRAIVTKRYPPFTVTAIVTAGAKNNAIRTGVDEGNYIEGIKSEKQSSFKQGTINIIVLTNIKLTDAALCRTIITATEAKTSALEELQVKSSFTKNVQATGTGTDQVIVVSGESEPTATYTGGHSKIGELIGKSVYEAVKEALEKQNRFEEKSQRKGEENETEIK